MWQCITLNSLTLLLLPAITAAPCQASRKDTLSQIQIYTFWPNLRPSKSTMAYGLIMMPNWNFKNYHSFFPLSFHTWKGEILVDHTWPLSAEREEWGSDPPQVSDELRCPNRAMVPWSPFRARGRSATREGQEWNIPGEFNMLPLQ